MTVPLVQPTVASPGPHAGRLEFLDGLRGIAAMVVLVGHTVRMVPPDLPNRDLFHADLQRLVLWPFLFGWSMVWLFLLISGFSLYWSEENRLLSGLGRTPAAVYARRRAWRILPTYYVALACGLVVSVPLRWLLTDPSPIMRPTPVTISGVLSHLAFVHDLSRAWISQANAPLWSVAVEIQLYALLPVLLAAVARRVPLPLAAAVLVTGMLLLQVVVELPLGYLAGWFFAGALMAHVARRRTLPRRPLLAAAAAFIAVGLTRSAYDASLYCQAVWLAGFLCLLGGLLGAPSGGWNAPTHRAVLWLGQRSYSVYAIHFPVTLLAWSLISHTGLTGGPAVAAVIATGVPASILAGCALYRLVEQPSLVRATALGPRRPVRTDAYAAAIGHEAPSPIE